MLRNFQSRNVLHPTHLNRKDFKNKNRIIGVPVKNIKRLDDFSNVYRNSMGCFGKLQDAIQKPVFILHVTA